jgi:hypothetical protein
MRSVIHLDDCGGGKATIFYENKCWKRVPREGSPDAAARWSTDADRPEAANREMGSFLEHAYRHPKTAMPIHRFPRLSAEDLAAASTLEDRIAQLDATVFRSMAQRRKESIQMGRAFNELKQLLGHGKWLRHFAGTFAPRGVILRTAERYMRRASKEDAVLKIDSVTIFKPATDRGAEEIKDAAEQAQAEGEAPSGHSKLKKEGRLYRLPLRMTDDEKDAMDALRKSPDWPHAEKRIISRLKELCVRYGIVNEDDL